MSPPAPPLPPELLLTFPSPHVLLLTLNRPKQLNAITPSMHAGIERLMDWFEQEMDLWVLIITGTSRSFCAGQDLKLWLSDRTTAPPPSQSPNGFAGLSRRKSVKPWIAAVNGLAMGGGMELLMNCDLIVASQDATFALPEVTRGVVASQGGIPRLLSTAGYQMAAEMLLLGQPMPAPQRPAVQLPNRARPPSELLPTALSLAQQIVSNSPDAVWSTKLALVEAREEMGMERAVCAWEGRERGAG